MGNAAVGGMDLQQQSAPESEVLAVSAQLSEWI